MAKEKEIIAYKAFDKDFKCRGFEYKIGETYNVSGTIKACDNGFHACENPLDVLDYYNLCESRFARVVQSGDMDTDGNKHASAKITVQVELKLPEYINAAVEYIFSKVKKITLSKDVQAASGKWSKLAASGDGSQLAASGDGSQLAASGDGSQLAASGYGSQLAASGDGSQLAASGKWSKLAASGYGSQLAASGKWSKLAASGYGSQLAIDEEHGVACSVERKSRIKGIKGTLICLVHYADDNETPLKFVSGKIGTKGLKENIWYCLNDAGKFTEYSE